MDPLTVLACLSIFLRQDQDHHRSQLGSRPTPAAVMRRTEPSEGARYERARQLAKRRFRRANVRAYNAAGAAQVEDAMEAAADAVNRQVARSAGQSNAMSRFMEPPVPYAGVGIRAYTPLDSVLWNLRSMRP